MRYLICVLLLALLGACKTEQRNLKLINHPLLPLRSRLKVVTHPSP
jgi:hypothetical protein